MNSNPTRSHNSQTASAASFNSYQFDFGLPSSRSSSTNRPLNDQKRPLQNAPSSFSPSPSPSSSWTPNKPSWTHQPAPAPASRSDLSNPTSMVGDIFGKSWASAAPSIAKTSIGLSESNPNLFGDLVGSTIGQAKSGGNVPLRDAAPRNAYSMGGMADSLPKGNDPMKSGGGLSGNLSNFGNAGGSNAKGGSFSGPGMNSGSLMNSNKDPFASLSGFGSKVSQPMANSSANKSSRSGDTSFGAFQTAQKPGASNSSPIGSNFNSSNSGSFTKMGDFGIQNTQSFTPQNPPPQPMVSDPLDTLFSSAPASGSAAGGSANQGFSGADDWGLDSQFEGNDAGGGTTELEGLPPPPTGVTASMAKGKGMDNQKQGQYADAIKWLSWAVALLEKNGDDAGAVEVLSCRASCYKEVGEYKKAVADCSKVLENDGTNVSVLLQRALLYESCEKYKLGAEDLRTVLKLDPSNRIAKSTIHRLTKMAE